MCAKHGMNSVKRSDVRTKTSVWNRIKKAIEQHRDRVEKGKCNVRWGMSCRVCTQTFCRHNENENLKEFYEINGYFKG